MWKLQNRGWYQSGTELESLQLDIFHALWEAYNDEDCRPRPAVPQSNRERDHELRTQALQGFQIDTKVSPYLACADGVSISAVGRVYDFQTPY